MLRRYLGLLVTTTLLIWGMSADVAAQKTGAFRDYNKALQTARHKNSLLIAVIVKKECGWCERLIEHTLSEPDIADKIRKNYVLLIMEEGEKYPSMLNEEFFPATFFIDPKSGQSIYENIGYVNKRDFLKDMQSAEEIRKSLYETENGAATR